MSRSTNVFGFRPSAVLLLLLVFSFLIRLVLITWGIGFYRFDGRIFHPDEPKIVKYVHSFPDSMKDNADFRYPTGLHHVLAFFRSLFWVGVKGFGLENRIPESISPLQRTFLFCRFFVILMGTACVGLVYAIVRMETGNRVAGLLGGLSLNVFVLHTLNSGVATTDVPLSLAVLSTYALYGRGRRRNLLGDRRHQALLGALIGLSVAVKYTAVFLFPPLVLFLLFDLGIQKGRWGRFLTGVLVWAVASSVVFVGLMPEVGPRWDQVVRSVRYEQSRLSGQRFPLHFWRYRYYFHDGWGTPALVLFSVSLLPALFRLRRSALEACTLIAGFLLVTLGAFTPRYLITIAPIAAVVIGTGWDGILRLKQTWRRRSAVACLSVLTAWGIVFILVCVYARFFLDSRIQTSRYLVQHYPPGTTLGIGSIGDYRPDCWVLPGLKDPGYPVLDGLDEPDVLVLVSRYADRIRKIRADPDSVSDETLWRSIPVPDGRILGFYDGVLSEKTYRFVHKIEPVPLPIEFKGETFFIYEKKERSSSDSP